MFSLIYAWINDWVNNREAGDLIRQDGHYDVIVMIGRKWLEEHLLRGRWHKDHHLHPIFSHFTAVFIRQFHSLDCSTLVKPGLLYICASWALSILHNIHHRIHHRPEMFYTCEYCLNFAIIITFLARIHLKCQTRISKHTNYIQFTTDATDSHGKYKHLNWKKVSPETILWFINRSMLIIAASLSVCAVKFF